MTDSFPGRVEMDVALTRDGYPECSVVDYTAFPAYGHPMHGDREPARVEINRIQQRDQHGRWMDVSATEVARLQVERAVLDKLLNDERNQEDEA